MSGSVDIATRASAAEMVGSRLIPGQFKPTSFENIKRNCKASTMFGRQGVACLKNRKVPLLSPGNDNIRHGQ